MNRTLQKVLLALFLIVVVIQIVLLFRIRTSTQVDQVVRPSERQSERHLPDSARASTLESEIVKRFDRIDERLAQIENRIGALRGIGRSDQPSVARAPDSARVSTLQSAIEKRLDRLDSRLAQIETRTSALTEIDQKITRLGTNLGSRVSGSWPGSTLQSDIERRFNRLDERLARIENKLK